MVPFSFNNTLPFAPTSYPRTACLPACLRCLRGKLLEKVGSLQPCVGISKEHLDENAARGFLGVAHMAEIALEEKGGIFLQGDLGWTSAVVKGCFETSRGVSGILGWVGARRVFWSTKCSSVAASGDGGADDRCSACRGFHRDTFLDWAITMAEEHPLHGGDAGGGDLSATQEVRMVREHQPQVHLVDGIVTFR